MSETSVQSILNDYGNGFLSDYSLSDIQKKAYDDILVCRTDACGLHTDICEQCGDIQTYYNSCGNRNCPQCQAVKREKWIHKEKYNTLDHIKYFHTVFTIPSQLHIVFLLNPVVCYNLLFKASADTIKKAAKDKQYLGADVGFTSVLHTWGQNLSLHPHIHMIISGGGIRDDKWVKSKDKFFLPVRVLSKIFRGKLLSALKKADINLPDAFSQEDYKKLISQCYEKDWVVYTKKPFNDAWHVIKYLGRYTHRIAISNARIIDCSNRIVTFSYKDYKDKNKIKQMKLDAVEFIRRFMMHVLPSGFMKIRHYGFLGNRNKKERLELCKELTNTPILPFEELPIEKILSTLLKKDVSICPSCGMKRHHKLE